MGHRPALLSMVAAASVASASVASASVTNIAKTEHTDQGEQFILPGAERSARQAAAALGEKMRAKRRSCRWAVCSRHPSPRS